MEDKIRDKVIHAYDGVVLEDTLRQKAKNKILEKARVGEKKKVTYGIVAAAAVAIIFILGNILLIRLNLGRKENVPVTETESKNSNTEVSLADIQSHEDLDIFALASNSYVLELRDEFYVAISCYDENGEKCRPESGITAKIEYAYFWFDEQQKNFAVGVVTAQDMSRKNIGAVFINGDWYEVWDSAKEGDDHYYEVFNITSPEKSSYARHPEDAETTEYIRSNTIFFAETGEDDGYLTVGRIEGGDDAEKTGYVTVDSRQALEKLIAQQDVYSIKLLNDTYFVVMAYRQDKRCSLDEWADTIEISCYVTENDDIAAKWESLWIAGNSVVEYIGVSCYDGDFYLIAKEKDTERYRITALLWDFEEHLYCDEGICPDVYANATFFARLVTEDGALYWQIGENIGNGADYSSKGFCEKYSWDEQCTKDMTMRDIYVAESWLGGSAAKFAGLEHFFKEPVQTEYVIGDESGADNKENAYQTDYYFECAGFRVSTEPGSDEIVSAALLMEHDYVTENVWIGMDMEQVRKNMGMNDGAFFEYGGNMLASVEQDGLLYEFQFQEEKVGENLPPHASYPAPDYVLTYAQVSNAAKIKTSSVKSMGEYMFGDGHSLEEGKDF